MCQGLLDEQVLAHLNGFHGYNSMGMIRRGDCDGIDIFFLIQHQAEILVFLGLLVHLHMLGIIPVRFQEVCYMQSIHVAQGDNIL
ncbi:hypothetical protein ES703_116704 [subsurface metagenome]